MNGSRQHRTQLLDIAFSQLPVGLIVNMALPALTFFVLSTEVPVPVLLGCCAAIALAVAAGVLLLWRYRKRLQPTDWQLWSRQLVLGSMLLGLVWGISSVVLLSYTSGMYQAVVLLLPLGVTATAIPYLAPILPAFVLFLSATVVPVMAWLGLQAQPLYWVLALAAVVFLSALLAGAVSFHRALARALASEEEHAATVTRLTETNTQLQRDVAHKERRERDLNRRVRFERLVVGLASNLIRLSIDNLDTGIHDGLRVLGEFAEVDRSYVMLFREDSEIMDCIYEWCAPGVDSQRHANQSVAMGDHAYLLGPIRDGRPIHVHRAKDLPASAENEQRRFAQQNIRSLVAVPMMLGGEVRGFLGFDSVRSEKKWNEETVTLLQTAGEVFVNALERKRIEGLIWHQAYHDALTSLPNRLLFLKHLEQAIRQCEQVDRMGAMLFIDLDEFKSINDEFGHAGGDLLLQEMSRRLRRSLRRRDIAGRLGGDEFVVILPDLAAGAEESRRLARSLAERMQELMAEPYDLEGATLRVTASIGVALFPSVDNTPEEIITAADQAMYQAKAAGRNTVKLADIRTAA